MKYDFSQYVYGVVGKNAIKMKFMEIGWYIFMLEFNDVFVGLFFSSLKIGCMTIVHCNIKDAYIQK